MPDETYKQACLTPKLGGLGLRRAADHAALAHTASWHEARLTAGEDWVRPPEVDAVFRHQKTASFALDQEIHASLILAARDDRERQRLKRLAQDHCSGWVTAVPSTVDGFDTVLRPRNFEVAVRYRLGLPVQKTGLQCSYVDEKGDHASCCIRNADNIIRHNSLQPY